jgi:uncharacterized DUF497 family protein
MRFEYDPAKSAANKAKHRIDFEEAQALWDDDKHLTIPSRYPAEARHAVMGLIAGKLWAAIVTIRAGNVRIISGRRARQDETEAYFGRGD